VGKERRGVESKYKMNTPGPGAYNLRPGLDDMPAYKMGRNSSSGLLDPYGSYRNCHTSGDEDSYMNDINEIIIEEDAIK
jgi:hypothetical protein